MREMHYLQIDMSVPEGILPPAAEGTRIEFAWVAAGPAERARVGARMSLASHLIGVAPERVLDMRPDGITYMVVKEPVQAGDRLEISGTVVPGRAPEIQEMMDTNGEDQQPGTETGTEPETETPAPPAPIDNAAEPEEPATSRPLSTTIILIVLGAALLAASTLLFVKLRESRKDAGVPEDM